MYPTCVGEVSECIAAGRGVKRCGFDRLRRRNRSSRLRADAKLSGRYYPRRSLFGGIRLCGRVEPVGSFRQRRAPANNYGIIMLDKLLSDIRSCTLCASKLPHAPRPVLAASAQARILIVGQAPGAREHASGIPWSDASGTRLRAWLGVDDATFYDDSKFAIVPVGFCYPGRGRQR